MALLDFFTNRRDLQDLKEMFMALSEAQQASFDRVQAEIAELRTEIRAVLVEATTVNQDLQDTVHALTAEVEDARETALQMAAEDTAEDAAYTEQIASLQDSLNAASTRAEEATSALEDQDATFIAALDTISERVVSFDEEFGGDTPTETTTPAPTPTETTTPAPVEEDGLPAEVTDVLGGDPRPETENVTS